MYRQRQNITDNLLPFIIYITQKTPEQKIDARSTKNGTPIRSKTREITDGATFLNRHQTYIIFKRKTVGSPWDVF